MNPLETKTRKDRKGEEGAALVMALLISFLLIVVSAGLLLESSANTSNVTDATAEQQAYNAAENGIQSFVDAMRYKCTTALSGASHDGCRVKPNPLYATTDNAGNTIYEDHKLNKITFARAVATTTSNATADTSGSSRLSRVFTYSGTGANDPMSVVATPAAYNAFNLVVTDPDNTGSLISFVTQGIFFDHDAGDNQQITFGSGSNFTRIRYQPQVVSNLNVPAGTTQPTDFGSFVVTTGASGGSAVTRLIRFEIRVSMVVPYPAYRVIRGYIEPEAASPYIPKVIFDSKTYNLRGSEFTLDFANTLGASFPAWTGTPAPVMDLDFSNPPTGYQARLVGSTAGSANKVQGLISPPEPARLRVQSTGYGPRGARKVLEAIIQNNYFNGLGAPATLTMVGPPSASNGNFTFNPGNSNAMLYSGLDLASGSSDLIPPVGVTNPPNCSVNPCEDENLDDVIDGFGAKISNTVQGTPSNVSGEVPPWLASPQSLDATVRSLYETARNSYDPTNTTGRVFTNAQPSSWGDNATGTGITFCDGDCELGPIAGGGILVVTGQLTLRGNFSWHGLIIVTGSSGVLRNGGGHGVIEGNIVVAPYLESSVSGNTNPAVGAGFLAPKWDTNGGGNSTIQYNSDNQNNGLGAISNVVLGVAEK